MANASVHDDEGQQLLLSSIGFFRSGNEVLQSGELRIYCIA